MRQVLAVDGGQSSIRVRHSSRLDAIELDGVSRLEGDTVDAVARAVSEGWRAAGALPVERAVLGLTTAPTDEPTCQRLCEQVATAIDAPEVWLADDSVTAHAGALSLDWGISITAGTGVACLAMSRTGEVRIIGGHGYLLGDEGGAFWIGREGVRAVLRAQDGRGPHTALLAPAIRHFNGLDDLGDRLHSSDRPVHTIATFAPQVIETADAADPVARGIIDRAADELLTLVRAAAAFTTPDAEPVAVALGGRLLEQGLLRDRLERAISAELPQVRTRSADHTPLDGAALLGGESEPGRYGDLVYVWHATSSRTEYM